MVFGAILLLQNLFANKEYFEFEKQIRNSICSKKDYNDYLALKKKSSLFYLPIKDGAPYLDVIKKNITIYEKKLTWIQQQKHKISLRNFKKDIMQLEKFYILLEKEHGLFLENKKNFFENKKSSFIKLFKTFFKKYSFLTNYSFPINHELMRKEYEKTKDLNVFFLRKIHEDGTRIGNIYDKQFRAVLSLLILRIDNVFRYEEKKDITYILTILKKISRFSQRSIKGSFDSWEKSIREKIVFYKKPNSSTNNDLQTFVTQKQVDLYLFLRKSPELYKKLFILNKLLVFEIGGINNDFFKKEILKVFYNRITVDKYKYLEKNTLFYELLSKRLDVEKIDKEHFLNAFFDPGEFSFTLTGFQSSFDLVCSDLQDFKKVQEDNIVFILNFLNEQPKHSSFNLLYYSRVSMYGRIFMDHIWDFSIEQNLIKGSKINPIKNYIYFDKRIINDEIHYLVKDQNSFYLKQENDFFEFHNPDLFRFFSNREN